MQSILVGIFFVLHGLVHFLYAGQSGRFFELQSHMVWPDGSWFFSKLLGDGATRPLATILLALTGLGFVAGGVGLFARQEWWRPLIVAASVLSVALFTLLWDGNFQAWDAKGGVGLLISVAILVIVLILK
jgi:hypothetical protein